MRIAFSPVGSEFPRDVFVRTPIKNLHTVLDHITMQEQHNANRDSISTAQLNVLLLNVAHGFSGSKRKPPDVKPKDFLPYPDYKGPNEMLDGPDQPTRFVLAELAKSNRIPAYVLVSLSKPASLRG